METKPLDVWVLTDGRAGNEAQALGLAEALGRRIAVDIAVKRAAPKPWAARLPARLWHLMGARAGGWPFGGYDDPPAMPWPGLVIGAGRRIAPLAAALRKLYAVKAAQILNPQMPFAAFDLVVVPEHDRLSGPNVVTIVGSMGRMTAATIAEAARPWAARMAALPRPRLAVLVGGPSASAGFSAETGSRLAEALEGLAAAGQGLMVTPSRRTPEALLARLRALPPDRAFVWDGSGENPYPGILGLADAVLVTGDSVNMASEAASTGKPVHVFAVDRTARKIADFHASLEARGAARRFTGAIAAWDYPPLAEADRVAENVAAGLLAGMDFTFPVG